MQVSITIVHKSYTAKHFTNTPTQPLPDVVVKELFVLLNNKNKDLNVCIYFWF